METDVLFRIGGNILNDGGYITNLPGKTRLSMRSCVGKLAANLLHGCVRVSLALLLSCELGAGL